jgi:hypothetical protein
MHDIHGAYRSSVVQAEQPERPHLPPPAKVPRQPIAREGAPVMGR